MSNFLDFAIKTREGFKQYILRKIGAPLVRVEITDDQLDDAIDDAVEVYTKYVSQEEEYYAAPLEDYVEDVGYLMPDNVMGIFSFDDNGGVRTDGINTLFTVENSLWNSTGGSWPMPMAAGGWVDYHLAMSSIEQTKLMTGKGYQFEYNPRTKYMTLYPDPVKMGSNVENSWIVLGTHVIRPDDQQWGENWVKRCALANAKITIGNIRQKFEGVQILGGGTISTAIKDEGLSELPELYEEIKQEFPCIGFWVG